MAIFFGISHYIIKMTTPLDFSRVPEKGFTCLVPNRDESHISSCGIKNVCIMRTTYDINALHIIDRLFFYDQFFRLIHDNNALNAATTVYIINDICLDGTLKGNVIKKFEGVPVYADNFCRGLRVFTFETETRFCEISGQNDLDTTFYPEKDQIKLITFS
jgi:hypothetical protein